MALGLDVSLRSTGLVLSCAVNGAPLAIMQTTLTPPSDGTLPQRVSHQVNRLFAVLTNPGIPTPGIVVVEDYALVQRKSIVELVTAGSVLRWELWKLGLPVVDISPGTLKKFVLGTGAGEKSHMLREVYRKWGFVADNDDTADAFALSVFGLALANSGLTMTRSQTEVVEGIRKEAGTRKSTGRRASQGRKRGTAPPGNPGKEE